LIALHGQLPPQQIRLEFQLPDAKLVGILFFPPEFFCLTHERKSRRELAKNWQNEPRTRSARVLEKID